MKYIKKNIKKIGIILSAFLLFVIIIMNTVFRFNIKLYNWYDYKEDKTIISLHTFTKNYSYETPYPFVAGFTSFDNSLIDRFHNKKTYIGEYNLLINNIYRTGSLFFQNNNYYFLYKVVDNYVLLNLVGHFLIDLDEMNHSYNVMIPMQSYLYFSNKYLMAQEDIALFFETYTFDDSIDFYSKFTDYITIENESKTIKIEAKDMFDKQNALIILDYKEKKIFIEAENKRVCIYNN